MPSVVIQSKEDVSLQQANVFCNGVSYVCKLGKKISLPEEVIEILENAPSRFTVIKLKEEKDKEEDKEVKKGRPKKEIS